MKRIIIIFLLTFNSLFAQVGGESIYNFLNLTGSARQTALGGKVLTLIDDVNQPNWNPATINKRLNNNLGVGYLNYLSDVNFLSAAYAVNLNDKIGTVHASINYLNYGKFIGANELGEETGSFGAYDASLAIAYSHRLFNSNVQVGGSLKFINSVIENYSSFGLALDFGIIYYNDSSPYIVTLVVRNMGSQISAYDEEKENFPTQVDFGVSYKLENVPLKWYCTIDNIQKWNISESNPSNDIVDIDGNKTKEEISFFDNALRHVSIGAELFSESVFNIQLGYNFRRSKEFKLIDKRTFSGFTAGFGIRMKKIRFNYAFSKYHPASNASTFSLLINLN
ncbi:type IX secretion system protein PorQ [uncultured Lutibacter sp.]|uniref:type IX secretion system protein PorQ n=1 Tax=uncultured Lutibacter sp. TaxID=437739 RepID=UPI002602FB49|nr:type IX secretion system protein PorQ [uncultured Lutibacter sp.]